MTLWAERQDDSVKVSCTYGPVTVEVTEHPDHVRHFWGHLGGVLCEAEGKTRGQRAYERYAEHSEGVSLVSGDQLPGWDDLEEKIRAAWEHSAG